jgi:beta-mannosidase
MALPHIVTLTDFRMLGLAPGEGDPAVLTADRSGDWIPVAVPGGVHEALIEAGRIAHPYRNAHERDAAWVEEREWWYRAKIDRPDATGAARLVFDGLDTVADVWLNGIQLGHHENMFRPAEFDVTLDERNILLVRFTPPLLGAEIKPEVARMVARLRRLSALGGGGDSFDEESAILRTLPVATTRRKAAYSWGWDFAPNLPSIGIWRPVRLQVASAPTIAGHHVAVTGLRADRSSATVRVRVEAPDHLRSRVTLVAPSGRTFVSESTGHHHELVIADPELWWTHDLGAQALHAVSIELLEGGEVIDVVRDRVGLRTIELDRSKDRTGKGRLFRFVLNGMPLFARGASWLPAGMFPGSVTAQEHRDLVRRARDAHFTMLRVWGGGVYEQDAFYAACDEEGVLVWQDFMFACLDYPSADETLQREVALEAEYQVKRLRNRACLAVWVGNNEVHMFHSLVRLNLRRGSWGWHFFHRILPDAVAAHDGVTPYWPGSPYGEGGILAVNGTKDGDRHTWEVWHGTTIPFFSVGKRKYPTLGDQRHYRRYAEDTGKFASEFGIHASPELSTLRRWIDDELLDVHSPVFDAHNKDTPKNKGDELLSVTTGLPATLDEYVLYTQAVQAEGMAFALEHYRSRQPHSGGALIWQFNDVWPGLSWSLIDSDGVPKSAYYAAARASAPVAVSFIDTGRDLELWLMNNGPGRVTLDVDIELGSFDGTRRDAEGVTATVDPATSMMIWRGRPVRDADHYAWASSPTRAFPAARKHFAEIGRLRLGPSRLEVSATDGGLRIRSHGYSYSVRVEQPHPGIRLSDNCFDLRDGDERFIAVSGVDPAALAVSAYPSSAEVHHDA